MAIALAAAGVGLVEGGIKLYSSLHNKKKEEDALANLNNPFYKIQNEFYQNKNIAAEQAQSGLTSTAKNYLTGENERGLGAGIQAILATGGSGGDVSKIFDTYNRSTFNTAAADSDAQQKNIQYFMDVNKELAGQKITQWSLNEYQPYENKLKQITQNIAADKANANDAGNQIIGSLAAGATAYSNKNLQDSEEGVNNAKASYYNRLFGSGGGQQDPFSASDNFSTQDSDVTLRTQGNVG